MMQNNQTHWRVIRPKATHYKPASCIEFNCQQYMKGWRTIVPVGSDAAEYMRHLGKEYREERNIEGFIDFVFAPGQECFRGMADGHRTPIEREPIFKKDFQSLSGPQWLDNMNDTLYRIKGVRNG